MSQEKMNRYEMLYATQLIVLQLGGYGHGKLRAMPAPLFERGRELAVKDMQKRVSDVLHLTYARWLELKQGGLEYPVDEIGADEVVAAYRIDGYYLPRPNEDPRDAWKRAVDELVGHLDNDVTNLRDITQTQFESNLPFSQP